MQTAIGTVSGYTAFGNLWRSPSPPATTAVPNRRYSALPCGRVAIPHASLPNDQLAQAALFDIVGEPESPMHFERREDPTT